MSIGCWKTPAFIDICRHRHGLSLGPFQGRKHTVGLRLWRLARRTTVRAPWFSRQAGGSDIRLCTFHFLCGASGGAELLQRIPGRWSKVYSPCRSCGRYRARARHDTFYDLRIRLWFKRRGARRCPRSRRLFSQHVQDRQVATAFPKVAARHRKTETLESNLHQG